MNNPITPGTPAAPDSPKRKTPYVNAASVLPPELVREIQKYHCGLLWVNDPVKYYAERRALVITLHRQNVSTAEIGQLAGITRRRVNQILAREGLSRKKK